MDYSKLGSRIKEERLKLKLTQEKISKDIDISNSYMGQIERGERILSLDTLVKIASRLDVSVDYLLSGSIEARDEEFMNEVKQLMYGKDYEDKKMALDVIKVMFSYLDRKR
jgi:transcriptional regulator with XRE-family HTH domain